MIRVSQPFQDTTKGLQWTVLYRDGDVVAHLRFQSEADADRARKSLVQHHRTGDYGVSWSAGYLRCDCGWKLKITKKASDSAATDHLSKEVAAELQAVQQVLKSA